MLRKWPIFAVASLATTFAAAAHAAEWHVSPGGTGNGTAGAPFGTITGAVAAAQPGDTVLVAPGTYNERLQTQRAGTQAAPIRIRSTTSRAAIVTQVGNVVRIAHAYVTVEGFVFDGKDGTSDIVQIETAGSHATIDDCEIKNTRRDCVDMGGPEGVTISGSDIHDCLNATTDNCATSECRVDAHGVVGGPVRDLVIRDTSIHDFSGDAFQADPGRSSPGWDRVTIERCKMWLAPLPAPRNGFAAGVVPGENAVDTKTPAGARSHLVVRDSIAYGFGGGLITNMAAFNVKEQVDAVLDRVTVYGSEIGFRLRGPSISVVRNAVVHGVAVGVRYEDDTTPLTLEHLTFGRNVTKALVAASSPGTKIDAANVLFLGGALPAGLAGETSLAVSESAFVSAAADDYHLAEGSPAVDKGKAIAGILADRDGNARIQGPTPDLGAFERCIGPCVPAPEAPSEDASATNGEPGPQQGGATGSQGGGASAGPAADASSPSCGLATTGRHSRASAVVFALALALVTLRRSPSRGAPLRTRPRSRRGKV